MSVLVIRYDEATGGVKSWRYEADHDYSPNDDELLPDPEPDHRDLDTMMVDTSTDPPTLMDDPEADSLRRIVRAVSISSGTSTAPSSSRTTGGRSVGRTFRYREPSSSL